MQPEQLLTLFKKLDPSPTLKLTPENRPQIAPVSGIYERHFYDISHLGDLITVLKRGQSDDFEEKYGIRYLVSEKGRMIFALEGKPSQSVPRHMDIERTCLTAGNIYFNEDYTKIIGINHDSGDFLPPIETLIHSLPILLACLNQYLGDSIELMVRETPQSDIKSITVETKALHAVFQNAMQPCQAQNTPWPTIRVSTNREPKSIGELLRNLGTFSPGPAGHQGGASTPVAQMCPPFRNNLANP